MEQIDRNSPCERDQACPFERSAADLPHGLRHGLSVAMAEVSASTSPRASMDERRTLLGKVPRISEALRDPSTLASDDGVAYQTRSHGPLVRSADGPQTSPLCMGTQVNPTRIHGPLVRSVGSPRHALSDIMAIPQGGFSRTSTVRGPPGRSLHGPHRYIASDASVYDVHDMSSTVEQFSAEDSGVLPQRSIGVGNYGPLPKHIYSESDTGISHPPQQQSLRANFPQSYDRPTALIVNESENRKCGYPVTTLDDLSQSFHPVTVYGSDEPGRRSTVN